MTAVTKWTVLTTAVVVLVGSNETGSPEVVVAGNVFEEVVKGVDEYVTEVLVSGNCEDCWVVPEDVEDVSVLIGDVSTNGNVGDELVSTPTEVVNTWARVVALEVCNAELVEECHVDSGDVSRCVVGAAAEGVVVVVIINCCVLVEYVDVVGSAVKVVGTAVDTCSVEVVGTAVDIVTNCSVEVVGTAVDVVTNCSVELVGITIVVKLKSLYNGVDVVTIEDSVGRTGSGGTCSVTHSESTHRLFNDSIASTLKITFSYEGLVSLYVSLRVS
jgi:hypothetical protein